MSNCEWTLIGSRVVRGLIMTTVIGSLEAFARVSSISISAPVMACVVLLIGCGIVPASLAQMPALSQPQFTFEDPNDVDLLSATAYLHETDVSIGPKADPLTHTWYSGPDGTWTWDYPQFVPMQSSGEMDSFAPAFIAWPNSAGYCPSKTGPIYVTVNFGHKSEVFSTGPAKDNCGAFDAQEPTGDTLARKADGSLTYTLRDGTQISFVILPSFITWMATEVVYPDGRALTYSYNGTTLESVTRSDGLELKYTWGTSFNGDQNLASVTAINTAYEYCAPTAVTCSLKLSWPTATYAYAAGANGGLIMTVADSAGVRTVYTMDSIGRTTGIQLPSSTGGSNITYTYCNSNCPQYNSYPANAYASNYVLSVERDGQLWQYTGGPAESLGIGITTTAAYGFVSPVGSSETLLQEVCEGTAGYDSGCGGLLLGIDPFRTMTDEQGNVFYGPGSLVTLETKPENNAIQFDWNSTGDLTEETLVPKTGSPLSSVNLLADYDWPGCNAFTCHEPDWLKDGNTNETDYTYNPSNGEITSVKLPADNNGIRPQKNYTYTQLSAWTLNSAGQYVASAPIWVRSTESYCLTSAATTDTTTGQVDCGAGANDKVLKSFYYGPNSGPNNLYLRGEQVTANGQSRVTCYGYDRFGNEVSETTPNAGRSLASCDQFTAN